MLILQSEYLVQLCFENKILCLVDKHLTILLQTVGDPFQYLMFFSYLFYADNIFPMACTVRVVVQNFHFWHVCAAICCPSSPWALG